ncbi:MAG TPA: alanine racemase [Gemmatimonadales bacterium]
MNATFSPETARAWVDIDLGALVANARTVSEIAGSRLLPMVKANGYGLGAAEVARALKPLDPWGFGVATVEEGAALRAAGIDRPILVVSPLLPGAIEQYLAHDLRPTVGDPVGLVAWCGRTSRPFHLEIDTGISRAGVRWDDQAALASVAATLRGTPGWEGVFTHFHSAEDDPDSVERQWERFQGVLQTLPRRPALVHAANSAAALRGRRHAGDLVRPGIFLYGGSAGGPEPQPVVALRARVLAVRRVAKGDGVSYGSTWKAAEPTTIATLGIGYADGFLRASREGSPSNRPQRMVELAERAVPVVGRVTMDMCMLAVPDFSVSVGDVATVYGGIVSLDQQAEASGTISYELLTSLSPRVVRRYWRSA